MKPVRVGVVGCGMIAQLMHLPYLKELKNKFEVVAVCDVAHEIAENVASRFGVISTFTKLDDLLTQDIDAVLVLTKDHFAPILASLNAKKHVFTEKPMAYTLDEVQQLVDAAEHNNVKLMVGYMKRYDSGVCLGLEEISRIETPRLARMNMVVGPNYGNWIIPELQQIIRPEVAPLAVEDPRIDRVRAQLETDDPSTLEAYMDMFGVWSHDLNVFRAAYPDAPESIATQISADGHFVTTCLQYANGMQCVFTGGATSLYRFEEDLTVWGDDRKVSIEYTNPFLRHSSAVVNVDRNENNCSSRSGRPVTTSTSVTGSHDEAFKVQLEHFYDCIMTPDLQPRTSGQQALDDTRLMIDIIRAYKPSSRRQNAYALG